MGPRSSKPDYLEKYLQKYVSETFLSSEEIEDAYRIFSSFYGGTIPSIEQSRVTIQELCEKLPFLQHNPFRDRIAAVFSTYPIPKNPSRSQPTTPEGTATSFSAEPKATSNGPQISSLPVVRQQAATGGSWRFEDFLHFLSAFNEKAPLGLKQEVAFVIYDSDGDGFIGEEDLLILIRRLVGEYKPDNAFVISQSREAGAHPYDVNQAEALNEDEYKQIVEQVFHEADLDRDRKMALKEFTNTMGKFPDFSK